MTEEQKKKKKYSQPKLTRIPVKNAADFLTKTDEEIRQFLKEKMPCEGKTQSKTKLFPLPNQRLNERGKEGRIMCEQKPSCKRPKKLEEKPKDCSPEQNKRCHPGVKDHPCEERR